MTDKEQVIKLLQKLNFKLSDNVIIEADEYVVFDDAINASFSSNGYVVFYISLFFDKDGNLGSYEVCE